ncbi:MAG TPA: hypothetical protein V6C63_13875 [Allocoleopsis sp.]
MPSGTQALATGKPWCWCDACWENFVIEQSEALKRSQHYLLACCWRDVLALVVAFQRILGVKDDW